MLTTQQAADRLGISRRTVQNWCKILGIEPTGRDYILTESQVKQIASRSQDHPGRPKKDS